MRIRVFCIGKKHDVLLAGAIDDYASRVNRQVSLTWELVPASGKSEQAARDEESASLLKRIPAHSAVWLLDETGTIIDSPALAQKIASVQQAAQDIAIVIGGAYGVSKAMIDRADFVWSLSKLVFPHQIVRLLIAEQLYRGYEILRGSGYHHS